MAPIGAGGMGEVYKARDTRSERVVAIKVSQDRFSERFEREARAVAALNHPNVYQLYDVAFEDKKTLARSRLGVRSLCVPACLLVFLLLPSLAFATDLQVTDSQGTVVVVKDATVHYGSLITSDSETDGIRVHQGDAVIRLKWSTVQSVAIGGTDSGFTCDGVLMVVGANRPQPRTPRIRPARCRQAACRTARAAR
jgi:hypothetical protein